MEAFLIYIAKTGICLSVFLVIYVLFLRPTTFFRFNRIFLLSGFMASLILPFIKYTYDVTIPFTVTGNINSIIEDNQEIIENNISTWSTIFIIYLSGILIMVSKNIYAYCRLSYLIKRGTKSDNEGFKLIENTKVGSPFTVINYILLNGSKLSPTERDVIVKHEIVHVKQKHWIDLLCCELIITMQWFNPLAWIYVQLLKDNHEFLADQAVLESGVSPVIYQAVLVNQEFKEPIFSFSNSFNYSKSLKRLSMMKKTKSSQWKKATSLLIVPVFGVFLWASATPNYVMEKQINDFDALSTKTVEATDSAQLKGKMLVVKHNTTSNSQDEPFVMTNIPVSSFDKDQNLLANESIDKALIVIDGVTKNNQALKSLDPKDIESISVLKNSSATEIYGEKGKDGAIIITTKDYANANINKALLILDGTITKDIDVNSINPNNIVSMNVLNAEYATAKYGEDAKYGAIEIVTKK